VRVLAAPEPPSPEVAPIPPPLPPQDEEEDPQGE
jgi:hypothetical protein